MAGRFNFTKMQGIGNDFVIVDALPGLSLDWSALALELCDRHTGIGADGLLVLDSTQLADVMMRMYNPDGTPDVCGNGLRCLARYAIDRRIVERDSIRIATLAGVREANAMRGSNGAIEAVTVEMGKPKFAPADIPMRIGRVDGFDYVMDIQPTPLTISALSTGSTHAVTFVEQLPDDEKFCSISPLVERHRIFPERTSLMWCQVMDRLHLSLRVWERGVGETLGCGTGACAAAVAAIRHGYAEEGVCVCVKSKGGELKVVWRSGEEISMTGPADYTYEGAYNYKS